MFKKLLQKIRGGEQRVAPMEMAALLIATLALVGSFGVARWSWVILDEQVRLRTEFEDLKMSQFQLNKQFEFWNEQLQKERAALQAPEAKR